MRVGKQTLSILSASNAINRGHSLYLSLNTTGFSRGLAGSHEIRTEKSWSDVETDFSSDIFFVYGGLDRRLSKSFEKLGG